MSDLLNTAAPRPQALDKLLPFLEQLSERNSTHRFELEMTVDAASWLTIRSELSRPYKQSPNGGTTVYYPHGKITFKVVPAVETWIGTPIPVTGEQSASGPSGVQVVESNDWPRAMERDIKKRYGNGH